MDDEVNRLAKIQILLEEYKTLRTEILNRTGYGFQSSAALVAIVTWLIVQLTSSTLHLWSGLAAAGGVLLLLTIAFIFFRANNRDIWFSARRIKEIEHEINSRAGEHLLVWERLFGGSRSTFLNGLISLPEPFGRSALPNLDVRLLPKSTPDLSKSTEPATSPGASG